MPKPRSSKSAKAAKTPIKDLPPRKTSQTRGGGMASNAIKNIGGGLQSMARKS